MSSKDTPARSLSRKILGNDVIQIMLGVFIMLPLILMELHNLNGHLGSIGIVMVGFVDVSILIFIMYYLDKKYSIHGVNSNDISSKEESKI